MKYLLFFFASLYLFSCSNSSEEEKRESSAFFLRGNGKWKEKEYHEAIKWYSEAIEKRPDFSDAYYNRGLVFQILEKNEEALADFSKATELDSKFAPALFKKAEMLQILQQSDQAVIAVESLVKSFPDSAANWTLKGDILLQKNDLTGSLSSYDRSLALDSTSIETLINKGVVLQEMNEIDLAEAVFKKALKSGKYQDLLNNNLGYLAIQRMQWDLAASYVKKALEKDPKNALYLKNWAKIQAKSSLK
ncbi:tetratricopeptide repeat protein [Aquirufa lenticrescens]